MLHRRLLVALIASLGMMTNCRARPNDEELRKQLVGKYELVQGTSAPGRATDLITLKDDGSYEQTSTVEDRIVYSATSKSWSVSDGQVRLAEWNDVTGVLSPDAKAGDVKNVVVPVEQSSPPVIVLSGELNVYYRRIASGQDG